MLKIIKLRISQCDSSDYLNGILIVMSIFGKQSSFFEEEWQRTFNGNVFEICDTASSVTRWGKSIKRCNESTHRSIDHRHERM